MISQLCCERPLMNCVPDNKKYFMAQGLLRKVKAATAPASSLAAITYEMR